MQNFDPKALSDKVNELAAKVEGSSPETADELNNTQQKVEDLSAQVDDIALQVQSSLYDLNNLLTIFKPFLPSPANAAVTDVQTGCALVQDLFSFLTAELPLIRGLYDHAGSGATQKAVETKSMDAATVGEFNKTDPAKQAE